MSTTRCRPPCGRDRCSLGS
uniref:Uncharacterized protein n=1 Tax=Arundo donax TaxID=35708 RepID=A0A0A9EHC7_ARUDO